MKNHLFAVPTYPSDEPQGDGNAFRVLRMPHPGYGRVDPGRANGTTVVLAAGDVFGTRFQVFLPNSCPGTKWRFVATYDGDVWNSDERARAVKASLEREVAVEAADK